MIFVVAMYVLSDNDNSICANSVNCSFVAEGFTYEILSVTFLSAGVVDVI